MIGKSALLAIGFALLLCLPAQAGGNLSYKIALHVVPHQARTCETNQPAITDCSAINTTYQGCSDFDVFPVFFDLVEAQRIEYAITWPQEWGECVFTPCAGDIITGEIGSPGEGIAHEWTECHQAQIVVTGYAWFSTTVTPGQLVPTVNPATGFLGVTDCSGDRDFAIGLAASGVCGIPGENPCDYGCSSEPKTWLWIL